MGPLLAARPGHIGCRPPLRPRAGPGGGCGAGRPGPRLPRCASGSPPAPRSSAAAPEPGTGNRAAVMLSRLGALLQEAVGAVRPEGGRKGGLGARRGAGGRAGGRRAQAASGKGPLPGPRGAPSRASSLPHRAPPGPLPLPVSSGFFLDSSLFLAFLQVAPAPNPSPRIASCLFSLLPESPNSQTPPCRVLPCYPIISSQNSP